MIMTGPNRQRIIRQCCRSGDSLFFIREPQNPVDVTLGEQLGYLSRDLAEEFATRWTRMD